MVIAGFPNPALLPFLAAGGMVSGTTFGLFYTVMMQIGYNYYGKKALVRLEEGESLETILMDISKEIQPFTDKALTIALEAMPDVLTKSVEAVSNILDTLVDETSHDVYNWVLAQFGMEGHPAGSEGGTAPPPSGTPPPVPPGEEPFDWQDTGDTETDAKSLQELIDQAKQNRVAYEEWLTFVPQDLLDKGIVIPYFRDSPLGYAKFIYTIRECINQWLIPYRFNFDTGGTDQTQIDIVFAVSMAIHDETGYWF